MSKATLSSTSTFFKKIFVFSLVTLLTLSTLITPSFAKTDYHEAMTNGTEKLTIDKLKSPLLVQLKTPLNATTVEVGDTFDAVLPFDHEYEDLILPKGTKFHGTVVESDVSQPFARPGFIVLNVDIATLPNGLVFTMDENDYEAPEKDIHHPKGLTIVRKGAQSLGFFLVSLGTSMPLNLAAGMGDFASVPLSFASKMAYGAILENTRKDPEDDRSRIHKTLFGMSRGTGVPGSYHFLHPSPNPDFQEDDFIKLHLNPRAMDALFSMANDSSGSGSLIQDILNRDD